MAIQDLTPQLRTRLSRLERVVGMFITLATLLLLFGLGYYIYDVAKRKGWFLKKVPYYTFVQDGAGLKLGDPVKLMGFDVGEITEITAMPPGSYYNVYVAFRIKEPFYGYLWTDSQAKVEAADFLGNRYIEVTKGIEGKATVLEENKEIKGIWDTESKSYKPPAEMPKGYGLDPKESPALTERLEKVMNIAEEALPNILNITNQITDIVTNATRLIASLDATVADARPIVTNLAAITDRLRDPRGSLGEWLIPTNINQQLETTLASAGTLLTNANTAVTNVNEHLDTLVANLNQSLVNVAAMTGNLNQQVQANSLILTELSSLIIHTDNLVQGLKRHWLLKGPFQEETNRPIESIVRPSLGGSR